MVNKTVDPIVDLLDTNSLTLKFNILRTVKPTFVDIENTNVDPPSITLSGVIENPIGTTRVVVVNGNILSTGSARDNTYADPTSLIRTNILDLEADSGYIGTSGQRINVDVVDSANVPAATNFLSAAVDGATHAIFLGLNQFFTGELVRYHASGTVLGGLVNNDYYYVIESGDGLSVQLASVADPGTVLPITPTGTLADGHSLTPAQRFTVVVKGDATADSGQRGDANLDIKARLRESIAPVRSPVTDYSVVIDAVHTTGDADLKLWGSVKETNVTFQYSDTTAAGTTGAVWVQYE